MNFVEEFMNDPQFDFLEIALLHGDFPIEKAKEMYQQFGFDTRPEAFKEVIEGADSIAVAIKYGFYQL